MTLRSLSDSVILSRIQKLTSQERELTLLVLAHLNEIERRRLHLKLGYSSLFDYCTSHLGYSASAAVRRIKSARCVTKYPGFLDALKKNEVNISTVARVATILTRDNSGEVLSRIKGRSQREVEAIAASYQPCAMPPERVRAIVVTVPVAAPLSAPQGTSASVPTPACEKDAYLRSGCSAALTEDAADTCKTTPEPAVQLQERVMLQFSVTPEFMAKLEQIKSLAWHRLPANATLEQVFELALDLMIEKEAPARRVERQELRDEKRTRPARNANARTNTRYVPAPLRDRVFVRDGNRCAYVGTEGRRCNSTRALQVDHITPVARGGASTHDNLRLLCAYHNRLESVRLLGTVAERRSNPLSP